MAARLPYTPPGFPLLELLSIVSSILCLLCVSMAAQRRRCIVNHDRRKDAGHRSRDRRVDRHHCFPYIVIIA
jgi:hypothetical protein